MEASEWVFSSSPKEFCRLYYAIGWYVISQYENAIDNMQKHFVHQSRINKFLLLTNSALNLC